MEQGTASPPLPILSCFSEEYNNQGNGKNRPHTYARLAAAGQAQQKIASKKVGEVSVTYSSGASSSSESVSTDLADLTETDFGMQLLSLIKMYSRSVYIP